MARIYKESRYVLQLLIGKSYVAQYDDVKISFYTKNPNNQVMVDNDITIKRNIAEVKIESTLFDNLEDGLIKYIVYGTKDGIPFIEERISNYFLKTPLDFKPGESGATCNLGETEFEFSISDFGEIYELYSSDEGYDGWSKVTIRFANNDWAYIYNAGKIFEDYNNGMSPALGNYSYVCGKITEIQEVNTSAENNYASFTLDNCFKVSKAKWNYKNKDQFESEDQIKVGACAVVFGVFQDNNGSLQFEEGTSRIIAYQECAGGESGTTCNLGETEFEFSIWDFPEIFELYSSDEGYDGWSKVTIKFANGEPFNVYNAGQVFKDYSQGMSPGIGNYSYVCGKITEIQEVNTSAENNYASFTLDNCFKVDKCRWLYDNKMGFESEDQIKVGACAVVFGVFQDNNGSLQFEEGTGMVVAYQECAGGESGTTCNLGVLDWTLTSPSTEVKNASDDGYDGYSQVTIRPENVISQEKESAINDFKNKMDEITITQNGTFSIDDQETLQSVAFDGNSYFDTGIVPTENVKIEACIKITNGNNSGLGGIIIGGGIDPVDLANPNSTENRGIAIGMGGGAIYGIWGAKKSWNEPYKYEGEGTTTVTLQKTNDSWGWESEKGSFGASTLYIGGYNRNGEGVEEKFTQSIVYIKIWTNKDDDSTMTLFKPKNMAQGGFGVVNSEGVETGYIENLGEGTATFVEENVKKYLNGFKRVEVNVPNTLENIQTQAISIDDYNALIGNYDPNVLYLIY